jgi:uncharacterized protein (DUF736 family)
VGELIEIGAAWTRHGNSGEFLSVKIGGKSAMMFRNTKKPEGSKQPDWRIVSDDAELTAQFGTEFKPREVGDAQKPAKSDNAPPPFNDDDLGPAFPSESNGMDDVPF